MSNSIFWKLGADPEALLYSKEHDAVISATSLCGGRGSVSTRIGTDGHATTLELRPSPSKSVLVVMADLGEAMLEINKFFEAVTHHTPNLGLSMVAQAYFKNEPLGGHIHLSYKNKPSTDGNVLRTQRTLAHTVHKLVHEFSEFYKVYDPSVTSRNNSSYGEGGELYRSQPGGVNFERFEYRIPPTWLSTPLTAYCYLGLAKLAMVSDPAVFSSRAQLSLVDFVTHLVNSLDHSGELKQLPTAIKRFMELEPPGTLYVDFKKWAKFLNGGKE